MKNNLFFKFSLNRAHFNVFYSQGAEKRKYPSPKCQYFKFSFYAAIQICLILLNHCHCFLCLPLSTIFSFYLGKNVKHGTVIFSGNETYNSTAWNATNVANTTFAHNSTYIHHSLITTPSEEYYK